MRALSACLLTGAAVAALAVPPASATGGYDGAPAPGRSITVFLKPPDPAALARLAGNHTLSHAARVAAVQRLLPDDDERATAATALRSRGFTVTDETTWSVTATAPLDTVADTFGSRPALPSHPTTADRRSAEGALPRIPSALSRVATAVYPTTGGPAAFHDSLRSVDGAQLRNAYTSPARTAAKAAPYSGVSPSGTTLTIASIQLGGWNSSDLSAYADAHGIPYSGDDLTEVPVDQPAVPVPSRGDDSDIEVDLDQEALLSVDPYAHQRAYFAPNTAAGYADAYAQVLDDVLGNSAAYQGGDSHIVALTSSWGNCEAEVRTREIRQVLEPIMQSLDAAGVTLFASSGDAGAYDGCGRSAHVDYPASSPEAVGVGGTRLATPDAAANTGSNWTETAWSCTSRTSCNGFGGSGGGESAVFGKPSYQEGHLTGSPYRSARDRLVPDISSDADPDTGFVIYTSDPSDSLESPELQVGGTSFAAPTQAALFTDMLAAHGVKSGIGDIHQALYSASGDAEAFRDVTSGRNGASGAAPAGASVHAGAGYDTVTGLGTPLWPGIAAYLFPGRSPKVVTTLSDPRLHKKVSTYQVKATWSSRSSSGGSPIRRTALAVRRAGASGYLRHTIRSAANGTITFTGKPGAAYTLTAVTTDTAGNISRAVSRSLTVPVDDRNLKLSGSWRRRSSGVAVGGSYVTATATSSSATARVTGRRYFLFVRVGPSLGQMIVKVNGVRRMIVNLHSARAREMSLRVYGNASIPGTPAPADPRPGRWQQGHRRRRHLDAALTPHLRK